MRSEPGVDRRELAGVPFQEPGEAGTVVIEADARPSVLVADDAELNQMLLGTLLEMWGYAPRIVSDGKTAVEAALGALAGGRPFEVIIMDMRMPVMDGYAATAALRARGYAGAILALTAEDEAGERERCLETGCDDFLTKPIDESFRGVVAKYVGFRREIERTLLHGL